MNAQRWTAVFAAVALVAAACSGDDEVSGPTTTVEGARNTPATVPAGGSVDGSDGDSSSGRGPGGQENSGRSLGVRLSEGTAAGSQDASSDVVEGAALTPAEVNAVIDRLPEWEIPDDAVAEFNRPVDSLRPPVVGATVDAPFPQAPGAASVPAASPDGPLEVLRTQPEGDVELAPFIALTFDQPMVDLGTLEQLGDVEVPVTIEPDITETAGIDGRWRWVGTRTLRFEVTPEPGAGGNAALDRLPAATEYTVTVPAGTESVNGATLDDEVSFTFSTPAVVPQALDGLGDAMELDPVFVVTFDQRVDPDAVIEAIDLDAGDVDSVRLATQAELDGDSTARSTFDRAPTGRAVAFVPTASLTPDTRVRVGVGPQIPSLEGPRVADGVLNESGRTYSPLEIDRFECVEPCAPFSPFSIEFNNTLDIEAFDPTWINVEPAVPGLRVDNLGPSLQIRGATAGNTTYTVTISPDIVDVYGQTLSKEWTEEFDVGDARPLFVGPDRRFVTTDPSSEHPTLSFTTVNHDELSVTAWQVAPGEYGEYLEYVAQTDADTLPGEPRWPVVLDTKVDVDAVDNQLVETVVDLTEAFDESGGPIVLRVEPDPALSPRDDDWFRNLPTYVWVQDTEIGIDAFVVDDEVLVWVTDLVTGAPIDGAEVTTLGATSRVTTGSDGVARIDLGPGVVEGLVATSGARSGMIPSGRFNGWTRSERAGDSRWYVIDDRGVYRPGETVRITGLVRQITADDAQVEQFLGDRFLRYQAFDPAGNELASEAVPLNSVGGFNLSVDVPEASNTGAGYVQFYVTESASQTDSNISWFHEFQVQDFRTPDFEVQARAESEGPYYVVESATVAAEAHYFAGGPLGDAEVNWFVSTTNTSYSPPNWRDFSFGLHIPWWYFGFDEFGGDAFDGGFGGFGGKEQRLQEFTGRTDAGGQHFLQLDFVDTPTSSDPETDVGEVDQPTSVTAEVTVFDVNRQAISASTDLLVHPARYYVGLRSDRGFVEQGDPIVIDTTVVDVDGNAVAGRRFDVVAGRVDYAYDGGGYVEEVVDEQTCSVTSTDSVTNAEIDEAMRCEFATEIGGRYQITATVTDDDGRSNRAEYTQYVSGGPARPTRDLTQGEVVIIPDVEFHAPGDTAELLVQAPFAPASGLLTVTRAGVESVHAFEAPHGSAVLAVPIAEDDIPNLDVRVDMVGSSERLADDGTPLPDAPARPAYAVGQLRLQIPPVTRTLDVVATPASSEMLPGGSTSVDVTVLDASGQPVPGAGVALIVVDEAVLSLSDYELADPVDAIYSSVSTRIRPELIRDSIILANPDLFGGDSSVGDAPATNVESDEEMQESADFDDGAAGGAADGSAAPASSRAVDAAGEVSAVIDVRENFDALAVFAPDETTDASGAVTVPVELPDNLTRYRVMAVGASGDDRFGSGESTITARLPVSVRPSAPRFLNFGDRFELPVVVQNQTDAAVEVDVAIQVANLSLDGEPRQSAGQRVTVPANDRIEVRFPASAEEVGTARFRVATVSGDFADAATIELPVYTPATSEAFATYGVLDEDTPIAQPLLAPTDVFSQFGGLEISTSSTALQALTDSILYLYEYRYESADGLGSRIMAVAALRDVLDAFDADGLPDPTALDAAVARDIERLQALQNDDGGFPYWQRGRPSVPWVSVYSTHALVLAERNGYEVDRATLDVALEHIRNIEDHVPSGYSQSVRDAIGAYALFTRNIAGDADPSKALGLYRRAGDDTLELDSIAQLWTVIDDADISAEIERRIENAAVETAAAVTFATSYGEDAYVIAHSSRRGDGIILDALVRMAPDSDVVPKVVAGLLAGQRQGRWNNAYENSFILLALNEYFDTFESVDPDFVARAWLGETYAAESEFEGRSTDTHLTTVPTATLIENGNVDLVLDKDGAGRLYYRLALRYAPDDLDLDARDEGFVVERSYEAIDDDADVSRAADGTWEIAAGASVRVRLTMVADARRTHVALIDPLPAGLEAVNPALGTSLTVPADDASVTYSGSWWWQWYEFQNLRDDRAEAFTSYLPGGTYEYTYVARATTPGEFVVPPTRAEEIYAPEVFGRSSSDRVVVTDR